MHKVNPAYVALAMHTAGGAYATIGQVNDGEGGQMTGGNSPGGQSGMSGESAGKDPAPQNYGFTSVVADGENIGSGKGKGAEALMSFAGGNRSFPVMGAMDDRRHRLKGLDKIAKGSVGMYGLKEWNQQFLNTADGMFMTGDTERKMRFALVKNKNGQQQQGGGQGGGASATQFAAGGDGGGSGGGESGGKEQGEKLGQESNHKEESECYIEQTKERTEHVNDQHIIRRTSNVAFEVNKDDKCYVAGLKKEHKFAEILTVDGPMPKGMGRID